MLSAKRLFTVFGIIGLIVASLTTFTAHYSIATPPTVRIDSDSLPSREAIYNRFFRDRNLLVVYGTESARERASFRTAIEQSGWRWRTNLRFKHVDEITPTDLETGAVLLVGTPASNPLLTQLPADLPMRFSLDGFSFFGKNYTEKDDVISLLYPNPYNVAYPIFVVAGHSEPAVREALNDRIRAYDFQIVRNGHRLRIGHFSQQENSRWQHDPEKDIDFESDVRLVGTTANFRYYAHNTPLDHDVLANVMSHREQNAKRVAGFLDRDLPSDAPVSYYIYGSVQDKAVITNSMDFSHADQNEARVHVAVSEYIRGDQLGKETTVLLRQVLGKSATTMLEDGLRIYLNDAWFGKSYREWFSRIAHAKMSLPASTLLSNEAYLSASPLVREPLAAGLVGCMLEEWGKDNFLDHYNDWKPSNSELKIIESLWTSCLDQAQQNAQPVPHRPLQNGDDFHRGFNFAHEGHGIVNGYGSLAARKALASLDDMGANAVSVIPYTYMRDPTVANSFRLPNTAGDEHDAAVAHASMAARDLGMISMLKPHIWIRGSWPGDVEMQSEEGWDAFFGHYDELIAHYAMLAEIFEIDIFCIGNELTKATMAYEDRWVDLAKRVRSIYGGPLVYAPNWGAEFENLSFWEAFDYIGLNSYYPLSEEENPTEAALRKGAEEVVNRLEKVAKKT